MAAELALSALLFLPTPLLVLNSLKTIILANEAMGRPLGLKGGYDDQTGEDISITNTLKGQTLSQMGIDILVDGNPVWV